MIRYSESCEDLTPDQMRGFFVGWPHPPSPETHLRLLYSSDMIVLASDDATGNVVGFVTAVGDGVLSAYLPLLEVLPEYQGRGIGRELMRRILHRLEGLYMVDLSCDPGLQEYYEKLGMRKATGMMIRRFDCQSGKM
jgi:ribosomal protein S18 acetylase RimI-like enzyme